MYKPKFEKPKITPSFKKRILRDWNTCFPSLLPDGTLSLGRRVGPLLLSVGFDVSRGREDYEPGVGVHNLSNSLDFLTSTLNTNLKGSPSHITVRAHEEGRYIEAAERMKQQSPLPLEGPITLNMIVGAYEKYVEKEGSSVIDLLQDPALIAAWAEQKEKAEKALRWGYEEFAKWEPEWRERYGGLEGWYKDMQERISNPAKLRAIAEEQAIFHKVDHIPMEELVID
ncbi:MAG TPA: hypothetical protein VMW10_05645 [Alphaproteobacteria bacterium]|nr:hypothetical protein [Alphaproteobacteria bacterium]